MNEYGYRQRHASLPAKTLIPTKPLHKRSKILLFDRSMRRDGRQISEAISKSNSLGSTYLGPQEIPAPTTFPPLNPLLPIRPSSLREAKPKTPSPTPSDYMRMYQCRCQFKFQPLTSHLPNPSQNRAILIWSYTAGYKLSQRSSTTDLQITTLSMCLIGQGREAETPSVFIHSRKHAHTLKHTHTHTHTPSIPHTHSPSPSPLLCSVPFSSFIPHLSRSHLPFSLPPSLTHPFPHPSPHSFIHYTHTTQQPTTPQPPFSHSPIHLFSLSLSLSLSHTTTTPSQQKNPPLLNPRPESPQISSNRDWESNPHSALRVSKTLLQCHLSIPCMYVSSPIRIHKNLNNLRAVDR